MGPEGEALSEAQVAGMVARAMKVVRLADAEMKKRRVRARVEWAAPIIVRPTRAQEVKRFAGWNVHRQFNGRAIAKYMTENGVTHLTISEHGINSAKPKEKQHHGKELVEAGYRLWWSESQVVIYTSDVWHGRGRMGDKCASNRGRMMAQTFQTKAGDGKSGGGEEWLGVISVYGVSGSGQEDPLEGMTRGEVRRRLTASVREQTALMEARHPGIKVIIIGDLNDTTSASTLECVGAKARGPHAEGVVAFALAQGWTSAVRAMWPTRTVVSHYATHGARLLDHCMTNAAARRAVRFAAIGNAGPAELVASDHDPVLCDLELSVETSEDMRSQLALRFAFGRVVEMPVQVKEAEQGKPPPPRFEVGLDSTWLCGG